MRPVQEREQVQEQVRNQSSLNGHTPSYLTPSTAPGGTSMTRGNGYNVSGPRGALPNYSTNPWHEQLQDSASLDQHTRGRARLTTGNENMQNDSTLRGLSGTPQIASMNPYRDHGVQSSSHRGNQMPSSSRENVNSDSQYQIPPLTLPTSGAVANGHGAQQHQYQGGHSLSQSSRDNQNSTGDATHMHSNALPRPQLPSIREQLPDFRQITQQSQYQGGVYLSHNSWNNGQQNSGSTNSNTSRGSGSRRDLEVAQALNNLSESRPPVSLGDSLYRNPPAFFEGLETLALRHPPTPPDSPEFDADIREATRIPLETWDWSGVSAGNLTDILPRTRRNLQPRGSSERLDVMAIGNITTADVSNLRQPSQTDMWSSRISGLSGFGDLGGSSSNSRPSAAEVESTRAQNERAQDSIRDAAPSSSESSNPLIIPRVIVDEPMLRGRRARSPSLCSRRECDLEEISDEEKGRPRKRPKGKEPSRKSEDNM